MSSKQFALPSQKKGGKGGYPIPDAAHARNALSRVSQFGSPSEKAAVRAKVHAKFPEIGKTKKRKWTKAEDTAYDKKHGIKEGSKKDIEMDKKHGVKDRKKKRTASNPFGKLKTDKGDRAGKQIQPTVLSHKSQDSRLNTGKTLLASAQGTMKLRKAMARLAKH